MYIGQPQTDTRDKEYNPGIPSKKLLLQLSKNYFAYALSTLTAGDPLKRYASRKIHDADLLLPLSIYVLLNLDKRDFCKFADKLKENDSLNFVTALLIRSRLPEWETSEQTVFPEWKARIPQQPRERVTAQPEASQDDSQLLIRDAPLKIRNKIP